MKHLIRCGRHRPRILGRGAGVGAPLENDREADGSLERRQPRISATHSCTWGGRPSTTGCVASTHASRSVSSWNVAPFYMVIVYAGPERAFVNMSVEKHYGIIEAIEVGGVETYEQVAAIIFAAVPTLISPDEERD